MSADRGHRWYASGLRFTCHGCGNCCRGNHPGWVYVSPGQIARIARFLELERGEFESKFVTRDEDGDAVLALRPNGDCVFWDDGCTVYEARPRQCRTFPFWPENLESPQQWSELAVFCHGVGDGRLYSLSEIGSVLRGRATSSPASSD